MPVLGYTSHPGVPRQGVAESLQSCTLFGAPGPLTGSETVSRSKEHYFLYQPSILVTKDIIQVQLG